MNADVRGVLITVHKGRLLLPNASIAEVITFTDPESVENAPEWLLGHIRWRGWKLPLLSFSRLVDWSKEENPLGAKVVVLKALGGNQKLPYFALLSHGFPRLVTVSRKSLSTATSNEKQSVHGIHSYVTLNDETVVVPDLQRVEQLIAQALFQSA